MSFDMGACSQSEIQSGLAQARRRIRAMLGVCVAFLLAIASAAPVRALDIEFSGRPVKLDILVLYDSRHETKPHLTRVHKFAEMPLNHLGYRAVYHDVNRGLPQIASLGRFRGVLTWFIEPLARPARVLDWLEKAAERGLKYVVLGEIAPPETAEMRAQVNRLLNRLGLEHQGDYVDLTWQAKVIDRDPDMIGFERPLDKALPGFPAVTPRGSDVEPHLVIEGQASSGRLRSVVVATSPAGGFAATNYIFYYEPNTDRVRWTLNPFAFFARALGNERRPIADTTTLMGRRIYFSHIDGDGWNNVSEIEGHRELQHLSAEVIAREAIAPFPELPVSVGLIAGDIEPALGGNPEGGTVARRLFAMPHVEVGSHTYTHPFNWQFFENYDRSEELRRIDRYQAPTRSVRERFTRGVLTLAGKPLPADRSDKYVAGSDDLPRTYLRKPFDLTREIAGSLKVAESLAPKGKPAAIYLWSGDTTPFPAAIKAVRDAKAYNMNGGDSRLDAEYPSVAYVPPISRIVGDQRQIYAANSNENTYTNDWTGPFYGFFMLEKTLDNTELPRRLKPFNLYYHMYSGEKPAALASIKHILRRAKAAPIIPIRASQYSALADGFFSVEIVQVDLFSWTISGRGSLSTVRFEDAAELSVDHDRSVGVLGANRHAGALYVALDPDRTEATVTLRARTAEQSARRAAEKRILQLVDSRWQLSDLRREGCGFRLTAQGFGAGDMTWQSNPRRAFRISSHRDGKTLSEETRWGDENGFFKIRIARNAIEPIELRFACHE